MPGSPSDPPAFPPHCRTANARTPLLRFSLADLLFAVALFVPFLAIWTNEPVQATAWYLLSVPTFARVRAGISYQWNASLAISPFGVLGLVLATLFYSILSLIPGLLLLLILVLFLCPFASLYSWVTNSVVELPPLIVAALLPTALILAWLVLLLWPVNRVPLSPPWTLTPRFSLADLLLGTALVAACLGLWQAESVPASLLFLLVVPTVIRARVGMAKKRSDGDPVSLSTPLGLILDSLPCAALLMIPAIFIYPLVFCGFIVLFSGERTGTVGQGSALAAVIATALVLTKLILLLWPVRDR